MPNFSFLQCLVYAVGGVVAWIVEDEEFCIGTRPTAISCVLSEKYKLSKSNISTGTLKMYSQRKMSKHILH